MADRSWRATILKRRVLAIAAVVVAAAAIAVTQVGGEPERVSGTPAEVVATIDQFQAALTGRDYQTICDRIYSVHAREAAGGDNCPSVLAQAAARLRDPRLKITSIVLVEDRATVSVLASTASQRPALDGIELVREGGRFRIDSLATGRG
jgi:hypothetical protein